MGLKPRVRAKVHKERVTFDYLLYLDAAKRFLGEMDSQGPTWSGLLAVTSLSALGVEAVANLFGELLIKDFSRDFERNLSPVAKLRLIAEHLQIPFDRNSPPFDAIVQLTKARNALVHPKHEKLVWTSKEMDLDMAHEQLRTDEGVLSKVERELSPASARRYVSALQHLHNLLTAKAQPVQASSYRLIDIKETDD